MRDKDIVIRQYLKEVGGKLGCPKPVKTAFLSELKESILIFQSQNPELTKETLYSEFGTPEEISAGFFDRDDYEEFFLKTKKKVFLWKLTILITSVVLLFTIVLLVLTAWDAAGTIVVSNPY